MFRTIKTYGNDVGLSCCFRQHRATHSHCSRLHGYAIGVQLTFEAMTLDDRHWVQDFGDLKTVKEYLKETFDHKTVVAEDDPMLPWFRELASAGMLDLVVLPGVGCEEFAAHIHGAVCNILNLNDSSRVWLKKVRVFEHGANAAEYEQPQFGYDDESFPS